MIRIILYKLWVNYLAIRQPESFSDKFTDMTPTCQCYVLLACGSNTQIAIEGEKWWKPNFYANATNVLNNKRVTIYTPALCVYVTFSPTQAVPPHVQIRVAWKVCTYTAGTHSHVHARSVNN